MEEKEIGMEEEQESDPMDPIHLPEEIDWDMLDKSRFFFLGAALFSGVSLALYPAIVLKTRLQICKNPISCFREAASILRHEGSHGFYRGFATSLAGTIPARALYMTALEFTKTTIGSATIRLGVSDPAAAAASNAAAGFSASVAAQIVWTPIDVVSQRLMVQSNEIPLKYSGGIDAFLKILRSDGFSGLYRGFGMSILTYAPSSSIWWASYSMFQRIIWGGLGFRDSDPSEVKPGYATTAAVQGASAAIAGGAAALVTMPLDTVKTRMQVMDGGDDGGKRMMTIGRTVRSLLREGGWMACYKGLGPRWASMSISSVTMITAYEFLKRLSAKKQRSFD